jgi:ribosome-associated protein
MLVVNRRIRIPLRELRFQFARSSGAGGQNVNKVSTKAILRWPVTSSPSLPEDVRERFLERNRRRITRDGELVMSSQRFRDQGRNVADCLEKLRGMLLEVARAPRRRRATRPHAASRERRLAAKRHQAKKKRSRGRVDPHHG